MPDLTTELRDLASEAQQARPRAVAEILRDGDRARRRSLAGRSAAGLTTVAAVAAAVSLATMQPPGTSPAHAPRAQGARPPKAQLTAWTVAKLADGNVSLTIRRLADPAGLRRALRADGVPASVLTTGQADPCHSYGSAGLGKVVTGTPSTITKGSDATVLTIDPAALPSGDGLQFVATPGFGQPGGGPGDLSVRLVQASAACTGA
jgi:hypothetical protein